VESTTQIGNTLDSPFIFTNDIVSVSKQVAKPNDDVVESVTLQPIIDITPHDDTQLAPVNVIHQILVEPTKEIDDELLDNTMVEEQETLDSTWKEEELETILAIDSFTSCIEVEGRLTTDKINEEQFMHPQYISLSCGMFKTSNLSTKSGKVMSGDHYPLRYHFYLTYLSTIANLHSYSVYCYFHPHVIPSGGTYTLLPSK
jgi:hypothetical protein